MDSTWVSHALMSELDSKQTNLPAPSDWMLTNLYHLRLVLSARGILEDRVESVVLGVLLEMSRTYLKNFQKRKEKRVVAGNEYRQPFFYTRLYRACSYHCKH